MFLKSSNIFLLYIYNNQVEDSELFNDTCSIKKVAVLKNIILSYVACFTLKNSSH